MKVLGPFNGIYVLYFPMPNIICSIRAITNSTGSLYEEHKGVAHCLEHMFFKRTKNKNEKQISLELDLLGTHNAFTNYDDTVYYINCRNKKWKTAFTLLSELLFENDFELSELEVEKQVILKEANTRLADPVSYFFDTAIPDSFIDDNGVKVHSIVGTLDSIKDINISTLTKHKNDLYSKSNIFFTIAGDITEEEIIEHCSQNLSQYNIINGSKRDIKKYNFNTDSLSLYHESHEQAIFCINWLGFTEEESINNNFVDSIFSAGFGGISSSILYERIRQELGLCYQVGNYVDDSISNNKISCAYGLTSPECVNQAINETEDLLLKVRKNGFGEKLDVVKENILHKFASMGESASSFASSFGDHWMKKKYHLTLDEILSKIEQIQNKDIIAYAEYLSQRPCKIMTLNKE